MVRKFLAGAIILLCSAVPVAANTVTVTWDPNPESDVVGYIVFYGTASGQYTTSMDNGNQTTLQLTLPDSQASYYFAVCAYNSAGLRSALSTEVSTTYTATLAVTGITSSLAAPQLAGTSVGFTATTTGGVAPLQFKWLIFDGSAWTTAQSWSTSNTFTWTPGVANANYRVGVWARNSTSTADAADNPSAAASVNFPITQPLQPLSITDLHANVPSPQLLGSSITFSASAAGGVGPYQYKWLTSNGSGWTVVQSWSTSNTFVWTPAVASSSYSVGVWVRSATSTADAPDNAGSGTTMPFVITDVTNVSMVSNKPAPQPVGSKIQFTATVQGTGTYQYKWWVFDGSAWVIMQDWSTATKFAWIPTASNPNDQVLVRVQQISNPANTGGVSVPFPISGLAPGANRKGNGK